MDFLTAGLSILGALITSLGSMWIGWRRIAAQSRTQVSVAQINDQAAFRQNLMDRVSHLEKELQNCRAEHILANQRIAALEQALREHKIVIVEK